MPDFACQSGFNRWGTAQDRPVGVPTAAQLQRSAPAASPSLELDEVVVRM